MPTNAILNIMVLVGMVMIIFMIVAMVGFCLYVYLRYKYRVRMRILTKSGSHIKDYWACKTVKNNEDKLRLLFNKKSIDMPEPEAINLGKRGVMYVEVYFNVEDDSYTYIEDTGIKEKVPLKALSSDQRLSYLYQMDKALKNRGNTLSEMILKFAPLVLMIMLVISCLVLVPDVLDKYKEIQQGQMGIIDRTIEVLGDTKSLKYEMQEIKAAIKKTDEGSVFIIEPPN